MGRSRLEKINRKIELLESQISELEEERKIAISHKMIGCPSCKKDSQLKSWVLIKDHHYIPPRGCSEGAFWISSHEYHLVCPKCQRLGRTYRSSLHWNSETRSEYYDYVPSESFYMLVSNNTSRFAEVLDSYDEGYDIKKLRENKRRRNDH